MPRKAVIVCGGQCICRVITQHHTCRTLTCHDRQTIASPVHLQVLFPAGTSVIIHQRTHEYHTQYSRRPPAPFAAEHKTYDYGYQQCRQPTVQIDLGRRAGQLLHPRHILIQHPCFPLQHTTYERSCHREGTQGKEHKESGNEHIFYQGQHSQIGQHKVVAHSVEIVYGPRQCSQLRTQRYRHCTPHPVQKLAFGVKPQRRVESYDCQHGGITQQKAAVEQRQRRKHQNEESR